MLKKHLLNVFTEIQLKQKGDSFIVTWQEAILENPPKCFVDRIREAISSFEHFSLLLNCSPVEYVEFVSDSNRCVHSMCVCVCVNFRDVISRHFIFCPWSPSYVQTHIHHTHTHTHIHTHVHIKQHCTHTLLISSTLIASLGHLSPPPPPLLNTGNCHSPDV